MMDPKEPIVNALLSSIDGKTLEYERLSTLSAEQQEQIVDSIVRNHTEIENIVNSKETEENITVLLLFHYLTLYKHKIKVHDSSLDFSMKLRLKKTQDVETLLLSFKRLAYNNPSWEHYSSVMNSIFKGWDLYDKVTFLTENTSGHLLPETDISYDQWLKQHNISENDDKYKLERDLKEAKGRLFFRGSAIKEAKTKAEERGRRNSAYRRDISVIFWKLYQSRIYLKSLLMRQLEIEIQRSEMLSAFKAIRSGTSPKAFALDNIKIAVDAFDKTTKGL